jgi:dTDP-4-dehydrorhamnose 3,5-epimerase
MRYRRTGVADALVIEPDYRSDDRGFFARVFCEEEFVEHGLDGHIAQASIAFNHRKGTLRGLHFQHAPHAETKIVRCVRGSLFVVAVDLRPESPTYRCHATAVLSAEDRRSMYVPKGCATGYQTLEDETEILYLISEPHAPTSEGGVHHADPSLAIEWPLPVSVISDRDAGLPFLDRTE